MAPRPSECVRHPHPRSDRERGIHPSRGERLGREVGLALSPYAFVGPRVAPPRSVPRNGAALTGCFRAGCKMHLHPYFPEEGCWPDGPGAPLPSRRPLGVPHGPPANTTQPYTSNHGVIGVHRLSRQVGFKPALESAFWLSSAPAVLHITFVLQMCSPTVILHIAFVSTHAVRDTLAPQLWPDALCDDDQTCES